VSKPRVCECVDATDRLRNVSAPLSARATLAATLSAQQPAHNTEPDVPKKAGKGIKAYYVGEKPPRIDAASWTTKAWTVAQAS
jgi:hypothetical protein